MGAAAGRSADAARQVSPCPNRLAAKSEAKAGYGRRLFRGGLRGPGLRERRASARARGDPHRRRGRRDGVRAPPAPRSAERRQRRPAPRASPLPRRMSLSDNIKTTPPDKRFPTQNQANHCWNRAAAASGRLRPLSPDWFFPPRAGHGNVPRPPRARAPAPRAISTARARAPRQSSMANARRLQRMGPVPQEDGRRRGRVQAHAPVRAVHLPRRLVQQMGRGARGGHLLRHQVFRVAPATERARTDGAATP